MNLSLSFEFEMFEIFNFDSSETVGRIILADYYYNWLYIKRLNYLDDIPMEIQYISFNFSFGGAFVHVFFNHGRA